MPKSLYFLGKPVARCFMDERLLDAVNLEPAPEMLRKIVFSMMKLRSKVNSLLPERKKPFLRTKLKRPTYPKGYEIKELGTFPKKENVN